MSLFHLHTDKSTQTGTRPDKQHMHRTNSVDAKIIPFLNEWRYERSTSMPSAFVTHIYLHTWTYLYRLRYAQAASLLLQLHLCLTYLVCNYLLSWQELVRPSCLFVSSISFQCQSGLFQCLLTISKLLIARSKGGVEGTWINTVAFRWISLFKILYTSLKELLCSRKSAQ